MKHKIFKNITIEKANIITIFIIFFISMIFVFLLVDDIYHDYKKDLEQRFVPNNIEIGVDKDFEEGRLKSILIKTVLVIVTLSFIIFAVAFGFYKIFGTLLQRDTQAFLEFFERASDKKENLDLDALFFKDFRVLAGYANKMVQTISEQKYELKELNEELEDRVERKTKALLDVNQNLLKEKQQKDEILAAQKQFLRYTVHETNTPLSVILASIELYVMNHPKDRQLSKIEAAVKNIFSIYDDLSYLVKKDQVEYPKTVINLSEYINYRIDFFTDVAMMSKVSFNYTLPSQEFYIYFNTTKLQRIVDNTITNGIKYTLANEVIDVVLKQVGSEIEFSVSSKSKAIKDIDKVFESFYREDKNLDGFGLGLQMVRTICDEEGVKIRVDSNKDRTLFGYMFKMIGE